ncbi:MAG TPA: sugar-binding protein [Vicinamibacterales bacterium]|nr:sugar-binding protein [Vicinamibacterales bacterium]
MNRVVLLVVLAGAAWLSGCGGGNRSDEGGAPRRLRFAVIPKVVDHPVFHYARTGAEQMAEELGNVDIEWRGPDSADELRQKEILESFIAQRVDGIAISTLNGDFLTETINRAVDAGIPIVTWDSDAPKSKRIAFYGVDDRAAGRRLGEEAVRLLKGEGTVAIITTLGATNLQHRLDGVREALAKAPGIRVIEVFDIKEDVVRCAEVIATASRRYPDLDAWISVGGWPVFTRTSLANIDPARTKFLAFDTVGSALDLLREGKVQILIGQKYFGWGRESVKLLHDIKNGRMPASPIIDSGVDVVTQANVEEYAARWKEMSR